MIEQTTFFGLPLRTQRQRRLLVVLYYLLLLGISSVVLWLGLKSVYIFPNLTAVLAGLLGGTRTGGPVKPYRDMEPPPPVQSLNIEGRRVFGNLTPLDEREQTQLTFARATAYRLLLLALIVVLLTYGFTGSWTSGWIGAHGLILTWIVIVYALSLPQSVLLWTEPNAPTADIIEISSTL